MDTTKEIVLTPEGRQKLVDELAYREGEKHDEIVERIKEARGFGDLSENSEYDAAKEEQSHNESRINEIRQILSVAKVVEGGSKRNVTVAIGTTVELADAKGKTTKYVIVGTTETNSLEHAKRQGEEVHHYLYYSLDWHKRFWSPRVRLARGVFTWRIHVRSREQHRW